MATDVSNVTKHFPSPQNGFTTTTSGTVTAGATTVALTSTGNYTNGQTVVLIVDPTGAAKQTFTGVVDTGGLQITSVKWVAGTNQEHAAGATVVDYAAAAHIAMMSKGILVHHDQAGLHNSTFFDTIWPVGSIYTSTVSTNPNTLFGFGTWAAFAAGRVLVGNGTSDQAFTAGTTGGESTHVLTSNEMPAHTHSYVNHDNAKEQGTGAANAAAIDDISQTTGSTGGGAAHNNLQPYIVVYFWQRTA